MAIARKDLLALPHRDWNKTTEYDSLYLVPTGKKHDSGYSIIAIIGCNKNIPIEIAATCDDICWGFPANHPYYNAFLETRGYRAHIMRTDCEFPSGILRIWASGEHYFKGRFRVHASLSSTDVELFIEKILPSSSA